MSDPEEHAPRDIATTAQALAGGSVRDIGAATTAGGADVRSTRVRRSDDAFSAGPDGERYTFLEVFARGGLGQIRRAYDHRLGRMVAVKEIQRSRAGSTVELRFAREAMITARLEHPAIVPVHDLGRYPDGEPFYCMKLVDGRSLEAVAAEATTTAARIALLPHLVTVAEAIAYAHERRIVHRDLKPANVLVGAFGEAWVIDWGLAKQLDEAHDDPDVTTRPRESELALTQAGELMGTLAYMPPEQASGEKIDARADVYALGAVLYQVLSGIRPYQGQRATDWAAHIRAHPPADLAVVAPDLPPDLAAIVRTAMAPAAADRYPDAKALSEELRRYMAGRLVQAYHYSAGDILRRWVRRNRALTWTLTASLALSTVFVAYSFRRIAEQRDDADAARRLAEDQSGAAQRERARADARTAEIEGMSLSLLKQAGSRALAEGRPLDALPDLLRARTIAPDDAALKFMLAEALRPVDAYQWTLPARPAGVRSLATDPGGTRLLVVGADGSLRLWDLATRTEVATLIEPGATALQARFDRAGEDVVALADDGTLRRFGALRGDPRGEWRDPQRPGEPKQAVARALVDHGERLLTVRSGTAELRDARSGALLRTYPAPRREVPSIALAPGGIAWSTHEPTRLRVWTTSRSAPLYDLSPPDDWYLGFGAAPDQLFFIKAEWVPGESVLSFLDAETGKRLPLDPCGIRSPEFERDEDEDSSHGLMMMRSAGGDLIVVVEPNGGLSAWDARSGACRGSWFGDAIDGFFPLPDPDGGLFATAGADGTLALWGRAPPTSAEGLSRRVGFRAHDRPITALVPVGTTDDVITASVDGEIKRWALRPHLLPGKAAREDIAVLAPGGAAIAHAAPNGRAPIRVASLSGDAPPLDIPFGAYTVDSFSWADEQTLLIYTADAVEVWDTAARRRVGRIDPPLPGDARILDAFPLPGTEAAALSIGDPNAPPSAGVGETLSIWSWRDGLLVDQLQTEFPVIIESATRDPIRFTILGRLLFAWPEMQVIYPDIRSVPQFTFTPDQQFVIASEADGRLTLYDLATLARLEELRPPQPRGARGSGEHRLFFNRASDRVLVPGVDGALEIREYPSLRATGWLRGHSTIVNAAVFSADDRFAITFVDDSEAILWDLEAEAARFLGHRIRSDAFLPIGRTPHTPAPAAFAPDGALLATVDAAQLVFINPESGIVLAREDIPPVRDLVFDRQGTRLHIVGWPKLRIEREVRREERSPEALEHLVRAAFPHLASTLVRAQPRP